jgi:hypothetical protein
LKSLKIEFQSFLIAASLSQLFDIGTGFADSR